MTAILVVLGEIPLAIGLASSSLAVALGRQVNLRFVGGMVVGAALLAVARHLNPSKHTLYAYFLRPLAEACLIVVGAGLRLALAGKSPPRALAIAVVVAALIGSGAVVSLRRKNARRKKAAG